MITVLRILYAGILFLWEQWRKDEEDVKRGVSRPLNFIVGLLVAFIIIILGYNYFYYRTIVLNMGQCYPTTKRGDIIGSHSGPAVVDYALVHKIVTVSTGTKILVAKLTEVCDTAPTSCDAGDRLALQRVIEDNEALDNLLSAAFIDELKSTPTTQQPTTAHR